MKVSTIYRKIDDYKYEIYLSRESDSTEDYLGDIDYDIFKSKWLINPYFDVLLEDMYIKSEAHDSAIEAGRSLVTAYNNFESYNKQLDWDLDRMFIGID